MTDDATFDQVLAGRIQSLVGNVMDYADEVMRSGSAKTKNDFIARVFPVLVRSLVHEDRDAEMDQMRAEVMAMFGELSGSTPADLPEKPTVPDLHIDGPPAAQTG